MHYINDIRELIGHTPLLKLNHIATPFKANIFAKLEFYNPGGSVKDRIGLEIIADAEKEGLLRPGYTIIEATAGNTGIGLAMAAFEKDYHLKLVIPAKFSVEKQVLMRALGAEIIITPTEEGIEGAIQKATQLSEELPHTFMPKQFENPANVAAHRKTGQEIFDDLDGHIDILVAGAGSGGTLMGIASYLKEKNPNIKIVLADPIGSILGGGEEGSYHIEGIGNHFVPPIFNSSYIDDVEKISDEEATYYVQLLGRKEGLLVGASSGAALAGAIKQAYKAERPLNIVAVLPDRSDRYFSQNLYQFDMNPSDFTFNYVFDNWAEVYDDSIASTSGEYHEVFEHYEQILNETVNSIDKPNGTIVMDIGSGTGNLTHVAHHHLYQVIGVDPNVKMRRIAQGKYPQISFLEGGFLNIPAEDNSVDALISSYAFHHLSDHDKGTAIHLFAKKLRSRGKVIITDTMYASLDHAKHLLNDALAKNYHTLANDLKTEYYTTHQVLSQLFTAAGFEVSFKQMNAFVWVLTAQKLQ